MKTCTYCDKEIPNTNKFCNRSCSAKFNNSIRSEESRLKQKSTVSKTMINKVISGDYIYSNPKIDKCDVYFNVCITCNNIFTARNNPNRKTCSESCQKERMRTSQTLRLTNDPDYRSKLGRANRSYIEVSFSDWLDSKSIRYVSEKKFYNSITKRNYFCDFYFDDLNLVIELDGNQHTKTKEQDYIRDQYIKNTYKIEIIRITAKQYLSGKFTDLIYQILKTGARDADRTRNIQKFRVSSSAN